MYTRTCALDSPCPWAPSLGQLLLFKQYLFTSPAVENCLRQNEIQFLFYSSALKAIEEPGLPKITLSQGETTTERARQSGFFEKAFFSPLQLLVCARRASLCKTFPIFASFVAGGQGFLFLRLATSVNLFAWSSAKTQWSMPLWRGRGVTGNYSIFWCSSLKYCLMNRLTWIFKLTIYSLVAVLYFMVSPEQFLSLILSFQVLLCNEELESKGFTVILWCI